jgi:ATP-binding cassette subfamily B protein
MTTRQRLYSVARPELKSILFGLFFLIISSAAALAYPQLIRWMVDHVLTPKRFDLLNKLVWALLVAFFVQAIAGSVRYYLFSIAGEKIVLRLRRSLYQKILSQEVSFFDFNRTGELMSRLASDCATLQNTVSVNVSMALRNIGQIVGGSIFMFYTSWQLSLLMVALIPPIGLCAAIFGKRVRRFSKDFQQSLAEGSIVAEETISGVRTVKSFVQEEAEVDRYQKTLEVALQLARLRHRSISEFLTIAMAIGFSAICFVLWYGGRQVMFDKMSAGDLTQFLLYLLLVAIGVGSFGNLWGDLMAGVGASRRVFEILEKEPALADNGRTLFDVKGVELKGHLEFRDLHFHYPTRPDIEVLKGVDFEVASSQVVAIVGSSGSGKSTLASLLPRFYEPTKGAIFLDGVNINELGFGWLREQIGIVSQEPVLISSTIEDNIRYGHPEATLQEVHKAARTANALDFILGFPEGFQTQVGEKGLQLSGGQKQRVAIARAVLKDPKILILDEATSNLDAASEHLVQEALQRLMRHRTTLVIAHRLGTIKNADLIFVLQDGQIVQRGPHSTLVTELDGLYYQLLQRQL